VRATIVIVVVDSFVDLLAEVDLVERAAARIGRACDGVTRARLAALATALLSAGRDRSLEVTTSSIEDTTHEELAALRHAMYDALDARGATLTSPDARHVADWFRVCGEQLFMRDLELQELRARRNEQRFAVALRHTAVAVWECDVEGRMTWLYNSQLKAHVDMIGKRLKDFMTPDEAAVVDAAVRKVLETDTRELFASRVTFGTDTIDMLLSLEALHDASGAIVGLTGTSINITEATRTREKLSQAVAFQEQMIGVLGHDLMNPLTAIQAITRLLLGDPSALAVAGPSLTRIAQATRRMAEIIRVVVDFTRTRIHGSLPISRTDMDVGLLCKEVVDELRSAHPDHAIEIEARGDLRGAWDYVRMGQVISNLVGNALKHGDRRAPVSVILKGEELGVTLAIINRGSMISAEGVERLFEPFTQGPDAATQNNGLGLGLYIVKQIVSSHGGTITAASVAGTTTLTVRLDR
jgi:PAS domain S-box-containing protein